MTRYIVIGNKSKNKTSEVLWGDLKKNRNVECLKDSYISNFFIYLIYRVCMSRKVRSVVPFVRKFACLYYSLKYVKFNKNEDYTIILSAHATRKMESWYLMGLKKKYNIKYVLVLLDPLAKSSDVDIEHQIADKHYDAVFSFDQEDCKKYGFHFFEQLYSGSEFEKKQELPVISYDIYFAGRNKGRAGLIYEFLKFPKLRSFFRLSEFEKKNMIKSKNVKYTKMIPYKRLIPEILSSNCLLELLQPGQVGITWRYCEAVLYNKKLLTSNKNVVNTAFYNPNYMHIIDLENIEESIKKEIEWIREVEPVDYNYDGRYSPKNILERIEKTVFVEKNK